MNCYGNRTTPTIQEHEKIIQANITKPLINSYFHEYAIMELNLQLTYVVCNVNVTSYSRVESTPK